jgi:hypothetical protein
MDTSNLKWEEIMLVKLQDFVGRLDDIQGFGKTQVSATYNSPEVFVLSIWLRGQGQPVNITYLTEEECDKEYETILGAFEYDGKN